MSTTVYFFKGVPPNRAVRHLSFLESSSLAGGSWKAMVMWHVWTSPAEGPWDLYGPVSRWAKKHGKVWRIHLLERSNPPKLPTYFSFLEPGFKGQICSPRFQPWDGFCQKQNGSTFPGGSKRSKTDVVPETSGRGGWGPNARVQRSEGGDRHLNAPKFCSPAGKCWIIAREPVVCENQAPISTW